MKGGGGEKRRREKGNRRRKGEGEVFEGNIYEGMHVLLGRWRMDGKIVGGEKRVWVEGLGGF